MAIINSVPGLTACVKVNGEPATEYENPDDEVRGLDIDLFDVGDGLSPDNPQTPYVIKYIEAKPGAPYGFHIAKEPSFRNRSHHVGIGVIIDGTRMGLLHTNPEPAGLGQPRDPSSIDIRHTTRGNPEDGFQRESFVFSALETGMEWRVLHNGPTRSAYHEADLVETTAVADGELQRQLALAKHCGVLKVALFHMMESERESGPYHRCRQCGTSDGPQTISEKALKGKALDCRTTYKSEPLKEPPPRRYIDKYQDPRRRPFAVYEFRYRSKEGLIKEGIIPRPTAQQEVYSMTETEVRRRLAELMEQNQRDNRESSVEITNSHTIKREVPHPRGIKREGPSVSDTEFKSRYKTRRLGDGRVEVDLTDD